MLTPLYTKLIIAAVAAAILVVVAAFGGLSWLIARLPMAGNCAKLQRNMSLAVKGLWLHKLRSFLSVLGLIYLSVINVSLSRALKGGSEIEKDAGDVSFAKGRTSTTAPSPSPWRGDVHD